MNKSILILILFLLPLSSQADITEDFEIGENMKFIWETNIYNGTNQVYLVGFIIYENVTYMGMKGDNMRFDLQRFYCDDIVFAYEEQIREVNPSTGVYENITVISQGNEYSYDPQAMTRFLETNKFAINTSVTNPFGYSIYIWGEGIWNNQDVWYGNESYEEFNEDTKFVYNAQYILTKDRGTFVFMNETSHTFYGYNNETGSFEDYEITYTLSEMIYDFPDFIYAYEPMMYTETINEDWNYNGSGWDFLPYNGVIFLFLLPIMTRIKNKNKESYYF
ncbi:MAG: hypothetical protein INQ03_21195 [Candidatus Heimdallarchaeota archaeon]|nr:hypothetical protein [Candidatus Heimdallarchaeota archaeon]